MSNFTQTQPDIYLEQEKILAIGCLSVMLGKDTLYFFCFTINLFNYDELADTLLGALYSNGR